MKKVLCKGLTIISIALICVSLLLSRGPQIFNVAKASEQLTGAFLLSEYETGNNVINFTPMNENNTRMSGTSWVPAFVKGNNGIDIVNDKLNVSKFFEGFNVGENQQNQLCLQVWLYFDLHTMVDLTIGLQSEDRSKIVEWKIDAESLYELLQKDFDNYKYDIMFYSANNVPWGWNLISLPFDSATTITEGLIVDGFEFGERVLDLSEFYIYQDNDSIMTLGLNVYSLSIQKTNSSAISCDKKQAFCAVELKDVSIFNQNYYTNEYFTIPAITDVFKTLWIGDTNLLSNNFKNEQYYKVEVTSNGMTSNEYYGKAILLENNEYDICFMVGKGDGNFVALKRFVVKAQSYGSGVWFDDDKVTINVDEVYELKYHIHSVFKDAVIEFEANDDKIIEIVEIDSVNQVVKIKGLKKGESGITIKVYDDRLINSNNEDGLENLNLVINVQKVANQVTTVKVMLWATLVLILGIVIYNTVIAIKKHKNFEVK